MVQYISEVKSPIENLNETLVNGYATSRQSPKGVLVKGVAGSSLHGLGVAALFPCMVPKFLSVCGFYQK